MALIGIGGSPSNFTSFGTKAATAQQSNTAPLTTGRTSSGAQIRIGTRVSYTGAGLAGSASSGSFRAGLNALGQPYYDLNTQTNTAAAFRPLPQGVSPGTNNFSGPTSATKGDLGSASGGTEANYGQAGASGSGTQPGSGGQREITCSICGGKIMSNFAGRVFFHIQQFLQRFPAIVIPIGTILNYFKERGAIPVTTALKTCKACDNKRTIKDPSDDSAKYAQAGSIAQGLAPQMAEEEAKMGSASGAGGNLVEVHAGHVYKKIGLAMNTAPSYRRDQEQGYRNWGVAVGDADPKYSFRASRGAKANHIQGLNPPAAPGGTYTIESANKISLLTGAQGVDVTTGGPVNIDGGITRITGPEVSIGSSSGRLALGAEVINMEAKSIEMAPTDGHVYTRGTMSCSGNCIVGGHTHSESASIVKLSTVGRNEHSKVSSSSNIYGGPAFWGGPVYEGILATLREMLAFVTTNTTHPVLLKEVGPISFRYPQTLLDNTLNMAYTLRPIELIPTGICVIAGVPGLVFNFPHVHAMPDQPHTHGMRVPDIDYTADSSEQLRGIAAAGADGHAPLQKKDTSLIDVVVAIWGVISAAWVAAGKVLLENNYIK